MSDNDGEYKIHFEISTVETIDRSVYNYIKSLSLSTTTNQGFKPVPIIWGTAERSYQTKNSKEVRDRQGMLILPLISIRRTGFKKELRSPGIFQGNVPEASDSQGGSLHVRRTLFHQKTLKFANADAKKSTGQKNFPTTRPSPKVVYRTITVPMPVNVEVMYEITLRTEYQQQMNELMVPFVTSPGTINYVPLTEGDHRYEGFIQADYSSNSNLDNFSEEERKFETKISIKVIGYVVSEGPNREKPYYAVRENIVEVKLPRERISLAEIPDHEYGSYYGLSGVTRDQIEALFGAPKLLNNVPAASFFSTDGAGGSGVNLSSNVVTTDNFSTVLADNMVIRELLKNEGDAEGTRFTTSANIKPNTEQVMLNGLPVPFGAVFPGQYTVENSNTIVFNDTVLISEHVMITYIKA